MNHRGEIVEKIVRKSGYSLAKIAAHLHISRNTLYNRFKEANLSYQFISAVGKLIHHDFTIVFPEMKEEFSLESQNPISKVESKYTRLLEKYNKLLGIVMVISDDYALHKIRQEIAQLAETEKE